MRLIPAWKVGRNVSFDAGVRYEQVRGEATGDIVTVDTDTWVPRLAASYDIKGDGRFVAQATYAWYAGKYSESQFAENTNVGTPNFLWSVYTGPAGVGLDFDPGFDLNNYEVFQGDFPTQNIFFDSGLSSPVSKEFTASLGAQVGRGYVKGTFVQRSMENFVEDFLTLDTGSTTIVDPDTGAEYGVFTNQIFRNSDEPQRDYKALQFIGRMPLTDRWSFHGNYTYQIENDGNFEGEGTNTPGISSTIGDYPEAFNAERHYPTGRLNDYQKHKLRLWTVYNQGLGWLGSLDVSFLYRYDSPTTFSLSATNVPLSPIQQALLAGYASTPSSQTLFFGERGSEEYESSSVFDLGLTYQIPVFKTLRPFVKFEMYNVFNDDALITFNTQVLRDPNSPLDSLGLPTGFTRGALFGQATSANNYIRPRTWLVSGGIRF